LLSGYGLSQFKKYIRYNSFDLLIHFLENPDDKNWRQFMFVAALMHIDAKQYDNAAAVKNWMQSLEPLFPEEMAERMRETDCPGFNESCLYGIYEPESPDGNQFLRQYVAVEKKALSLPGKPYGVRIGCCLYDDNDQKETHEFQSSWNGFLRLYNFYQFLPYAYFVTSKGNKANAYDTLKLFEEPVIGAAVVEKEGPLEGSWKAVKEVTDEQLHGLLAVLQENGWPLPEAGFELASENGEIIAIAELGWEALKIAFLTTEEIEYQSKFSDYGWKTVPISEVLVDAEKFMSLKDTCGKGA